MQSFNFNSAGFGLAAGGAWGAGDFTGGLAARRANVFGVVALGYSTGFVLMLFAVWLTHEPLPPLRDLAWAAFAGVIGGGALAAFYAALAKGKMGIVAPVSAVLTAALPALYAAFAQGLPHALQLAGFALALAGIWLVSHSEEKAASKPQGLGLAVLSGIGFGLYLIIIRRASIHAIFWPLVTSRALSVVFILAATAPFGNLQRPSRSAIPLCMLAGAMDVSGIACFVFAARAGRLDVAAVLSSLYPALTVVLARIFLNEHMSLRQSFGMLVALVAIVMIVF